jgi:7-cyano-7-deazaguanine synthase in queuosine biosynthesis
MPTNEHLVLCGRVDKAPQGNVSRLGLTLHGASRNVRLEITDISRRLVANIPDALADLLEVASYVYAADGATPRGGVSDAQMGAWWRRKFRFIIPVRLPDVWSSNPMSSALVETLSFLSEDDYQFEFQPLDNPPAVTDYFDFQNPEVASFTPDEVMLFSGGLDSLAGAVEALAGHGKKVALVSHRSASKIAGTQRNLVCQLRQRFGVDRIIHIPVWATLVGGIGQESTHRTRAFLFSALGTVVARLFDRNRLYFFENGVVSLNLPPVAQVVGARATRTTHPQVLMGLRRLLPILLGRPFDVDNPFVWLTKTEVLQRIAANGCSDLIRDTRSCTRVRDMTTLNPHCGQCSQCIDRRFAVFAAGQEHQDPAEAYRLDLFSDSRGRGPDREMALAYVRSASLINQMTDAVFFTHYGETSRVVGYFPESADTIASRIFDLHRRHATTVCRIFDDAIKLHAPRLREGSLPPDCLLSLIVSQREQGSVYLLQSGAVEQVVTDDSEIRIAIDADQRRVRFNRWGVLSGASAALIIALSASFRKAARDERAPENYPYIKSAVLASRIFCDSDETLRRRIHRCRNGIMRLAKNAGEPCPPLDAVIENSQWRGYRLNPDRIRIVRASELSGSE